MSGQLVVAAPGRPDERHLRVRFALSPVVEERAQRRRDLGDGPVELRFVDQRMFGGLSVSDGGAELPPEIAHIARDPFDPASTTTCSSGGCGGVPPASSACCSTRP